MTAVTPNYCLPDRLPPKVRSRFLKSCKPVDLVETLVPGVNAVPLHAVMQGADSVLQMTAWQLQLELRSNSSLHDALARYLYVLMAQLSQTAACTRFHVVGAWLVCWLLMTYYRLHADHFYLTHQSLADMPGVQSMQILVFECPYRSLELVTVIIVTMRMEICI